MGAPEDAAAGQADAGDQDKERFSIWIDPKTVTWTVAVALISGARGFWTQLSLPPNLPQSDAIVWPLVVSLIVSVLIGISNLQAAKTNRVSWALGIVLAILNGLVLCSAVLGTGAAATAATGTGD
jgi:hypothetical protein